MFKGIPEELLYLLVFAAVLLIGYVRQRAATRRQPQEPPQAGAAQESPAFEPIPDFWGRTPPTPEHVVPVRRSEPRVAAEPQVAPATVRRIGRSTKRSLMGSKRAVQNAIVVATILGPCRALDPHGEAAADGAGPLTQRGPR
jgi:hypothetical protein